MKNIAQETLGLRRTGISPVLSLLMSAYSLVSPPRGRRRSGFNELTMLLYYAGNPRTPDIQSFGITLIANHFRREISR